MDWLWLKIWEQGRLFASKRLAVEMQRACNAGEDARARKMAILLTDYCLIERSVREYIVDDVLHQLPTYPYS